MSEKLSGDLSTLHDRIEYFKVAHKHVLDHFKHRCGICYQPCGEVHEIYPRSDGERSRNIWFMIPLCWTCHNKIHARGAHTQIDILIDYLLKMEEIYGKCPPMT